MFILDADVILIDYRYLTDPKHAVTHKALDLLKQTGQPLGVTTQALLEVVGVLTFPVLSPAEWLAQRTSAGPTP